MSELLTIKQSDIQKTDAFNHMSLKIYGKGRKQRVVPLWKTTASYISKYSRIYPPEGNDVLFLNKNGDLLTRSGVRTRIAYSSLRQSRRSSVA